ncbi:unnamed protein product, partial [Prorocentrum cordatum]
ELRGFAAETHGKISALRAELDASLEAGSALRRGALDALNAAVAEAERRVPVDKSDAIPAQLLGPDAEPGGKLFPNLAKKVRAMCARSAEEVEGRYVEAWRALLQKDGIHEGLDSLRSEQRAAWEQAFKDCCRRHALALAQSDHQAVFQTVPARGAGAEPLAVMCWNVLEFPDAAAAAPVLDGINPYCDQLLAALGRKGTEQKKLLTDAMSSELVASLHRDVVLGAVQEAADSGAADVILLQELSSGHQSALEAWCAAAGWSSRFAEGNEDPKKCDAITAILTRRPTDEDCQATVQENKKTRHFAAARVGEAWLVSCHVPHEVAVKGKTSGNEDVAFRVLVQLAERFRGPAGGPGLLVVGGDWNADVHAVGARAAAEPPCGAARVSPHAPPAGQATCRGCGDVIDGLLRLEW